jgi:two-component system sensor histidine kinase DesK
MADVTYPSELDQRNPVRHKSILLTLANVGDHRQRPAVIITGAIVCEFPLFALIMNLSSNGRILVTVAATAVVVLFAAVHVVIAASFHLGRLSDSRRATLCAVLSALLCVQIWYFGAGWSLLLPYLTAALAVSLPGRLLLATLGGPVALIVLLTVAGTGIATGDLVVECLLVGLGMASFRRMLELVALLYRDRERVATAVALQERLRIARNLHDLLGHTLLGVVLKAELIRKLAGGIARRGTSAVTEQDLATLTEIATEAGNVESIGRLAIAQVRESVTEYRTGNLATTIAQARNALTDAGIQVVVRTPEAPLPAEVEAVLSWVVREGVTNIVRHSQARECEIAIYQHERHAVAELIDDGTGGRRMGALGTPAPGAVGGTGLLGLLERLAGVGGQLDAQPRGDRGFRLRALVPLPADTAAREGRS